jgi:hypothetical protein
MVCVSLVEHAIERSVLALALAAASVSVATPGVMVISPGIIDHVLTSLA